MPEASWDTQKRTPPASSSKDSKKKVGSSAFGAAGSQSYLVNRLQEHRDAIKAYGVRRFGLCGFFVCGERKETSDLDFVVEFDKKSFDGYMNLKSYLEDLFGCRALIWPLAKQSNRDFDLKESVPIECLDRPFQGWHTTNYNQKVRRA